MKKEIVNHPPHYAETELRFMKPECIMFTRNLPFCTGNAVKYIWRAGHKGAWKEDIEKAKWYINNAPSNETNNIPFTVMEKLTWMFELIDYFSITEEWIRKLKVIRALLDNDSQLTETTISELESWLYMKEHEEV